MSLAQLPTPAPDENLVLVIEIRTPEAAKDSPGYADFDKRFTNFKQQLDALVTRDFSGALKMKVLMKKAQQSSIEFRS
jgi:hypothetical protein